MLTQDMLEQKVRAESQHKESLIKAHLRNNESGKIDLQIQAMEAKKKKKLDDIELLKTRDFQIRQLAVAEKYLLDQLHHTIQNEDRVLTKLQNQRMKQNMILEKVGKLDIEMYTKKLLFKSSKKSIRNSLRRKNRSIVLGRPINISS